MDKQNFGQCLQNNNNDVTSCQFVFEALQTCQVCGSACLCVLPNVKISSTALHMTKVRRCDGSPFFVNRSLDKEREVRYQFFR